MKARILITASILLSFSGSLLAVDSQLLGLVMPDAKLLADVNVAQAKLSPFGTYILSQVTTPELQKFAAATGFDPTRDLMELLVASNGPSGSSVALATGIFDTAKISAAAIAAGGSSITYKGVAIIQSPKQTEAVAFLNGNVLIAGKAADVRAAIDRHASPPPVSSALAALIAQANQLSSSEDAWVLSTLPFPAVHGPNPVAAGVNIPVSLLQQIQQGWAGVKFGTNVTFTAQAQADTAQNATTLAQTLQLLINIAQMQGTKDANLAALAKSIAITTQGASVNVALSLPESQFQSLLKVDARGHRIEHRM